ncbi:MAG: hypothetical protein AAFX40_18615, partial [Cyanobacteria bacterium J06639_1]
EFVPDSFTAGSGIGLALDSSTLPSVPNFELTNNLSDGDRGQFFNPGSTPPSLCVKADPGNAGSTIPVTGSNNTTGAVVVTITNPIPPATGAGTPTNSYGFIRFRTVLK